MLSRSTYYNKNKIKLRAMTLARYENDLTFREEYQRYQAKYSQKKGVATIQMKIVVDPENIN